MNCAIGTFLDADTEPENENSDIQKLHSHDYEWMAELCAIY
jgi:hypothetical protein